VHITFFPASGGTLSTSPLDRDFAAGPQWRLPFPSKNVSTPAPTRLLAKLLYALVIRWTPYRQSCVVAAFGEKVAGFGDNVAVFGDIVAGVDGA